MKHHRLAILASGKGSNAQAIVEASREGRVKAEVSVIVSDQPNAMVLERARQLQVSSTVILPKDFPSLASYEEAVTGAIEKAGASLVCLAGYMRILGEGFVRRFQGRLLNIHPSLLPRFPGLHGVRQALAAGVAVTGCTVHFVDESVDTGPIIIQAGVPVFSHDSESALHGRIQLEERRIYPQAVAWTCEGRLDLIGRQVVVRS